MHGHWSTRLPRRFCLSRSWNLNAMLTACDGSKSIWYWSTGEGAGNRVTDWEISSAHTEPGEAIKKKTNNAVAKWRKRAIENIFSGGYNCVGMDGPRQKEGEEGKACNNGSFGLEAIAQQVGQQPAATAAMLFPRRIPPFRRPMLPPRKVIHCLPRHKVAKF